MLLEVVAPSAFEVTNLGVSGATAQKSGDFSYWSTWAFQALTNQSWDVGLVMLGTNDAKPYNWKGPANFTADYQALLDAFEATEKFVLVPPPIYLDGAYDMMQAVVNDAYPSLFVPGAFETASIVDVFKTLGGVANWRDVYPAGGCEPGSSTWGPCGYFCSAQNCDQVHPNDVGYARLASFVYEAVFSRT